MKKYLFLILLLVFSSGCANTKFVAFGIDVKELSNAEPKDYGKLALGAGASFAAHIAGHFIAAELFDVDIHLDGLNEVIDYSKNPSDNDVQWMARGGFVFQLVLNTALVELVPDSYFTKGYTMLTSAELATYSFRHPDDGDFSLLDEAGGNGNSEYVLYGAWATYNFCRISFKEKK